MLTYNNLDGIAQRIWAEKNIDKKRQIFIDEMVEHFKFPEKAEQFKIIALSTNSGNRLDKLAADLVLLQTGDKVVK